ncbi:hypothetical protein [Aerolutibacter ruishenii]|uniref:Uncharacterized protein n=1 Tax=Aerolutibacter ruishenii TaxID=686800 RepID=A0A562LXY3_9GAMM|nr:hypothetical protein [Lysobacter ruishenii]TWI12497.1 hypothetical protein IP93_00838 [Lysobacter ruishenii]
MAKLSIEQAPASWTPRLFLLTASAWAGAAGGMLVFEGAVALTSRWGSATLALVHALTLGFLGNAMFGSLLQFLPVAAGVPVRGGRSGALLLHGLLNLGTFVLVVALRWPQACPAWWGGVMLVGAFALLASLVLPGVSGVAAKRFLHWGLGGAVAGGLVTAGLGLLLALGLSGLVAVPLRPLTDVHAAWGVLGWVVVLLASVSRVVGPMFQGMAVLRERWQAFWMTGMLAVLAAGLVAAFQGLTPPWFRMGVGLGGLLFAATGLLMQARAPKLRKVPLTGFWLAGLSATAAGAVMLLVDGSPGMLAGVLAIGIGLPLLVVGMQLEIVAFLGWIRLHRRCGKGVRLPGVQLLLPERDKYAVLALHVAAAAMLATATATATATAADAITRAAGAAVLLAHASTFAALCGVSWRSRRFVQQLGRCT